MYWQCKGLVNEAHNVYSYFCLNDDICLFYSWFHGAWINVSDLWLLEFKTAILPMDLDWTIAMNQTTEEVKNVELKMKLQHLLNTLIFIHRIDLLLIKPTFVCSPNVHVPCSAVSGSNWIGSASTLCPGHMPLSLYSFVSILGFHPYICTLLAYCLHRTTAAKKERATCYFGVMHYYLMTLNFPNVGDGCGRRAPEPKRWIAHRKGTGQRPPSSSESAELPSAEVRTWTFVGGWRGSSALRHHSP